MRALISMECSGEVLDQFLAKGIDAWSVDLKDHEKNHPRHIKGNAFDVMYQPGWNLLIAHPDCTYLSVSGLHWNKRRPGRSELTEKGLLDVQRCMDAPIDRIVIENPISCISSRIKKPSQIIQPYMFGDDASKATCLWIIGKNGIDMPNIIIPPQCEWVPPRIVIGDNGKEYKRWSNQTDSGQNKLPPNKNRATDRARTFPGIAKAFADTWALPL